MTRIECADCGAPARIEHNAAYAFKESGLSNVTLQGIDVVRCKECRSCIPIIPRVNDLMRTIAVALIMKPSKLRGEEVRFLRKYLRMTQAEFSESLDMHKTNISKIENDEDVVGPHVDRLIRMVCLQLSPELKEKFDLHVELIKKLLKEIENKKRTQRLCIKEVNKAAGLEGSKASYQYAYC